MTDDRAFLNEEIKELKSEIARLRITDEEREAVEEAIRTVD